MKKAPVIYTMGASVIGTGHIKNNSCCQDSFNISKFSDQWGIAVVSDGAGSCEKSDEGSKFVCKKAIEFFKKVIENNKWIVNNSLPSETEWKNIAGVVMMEISNELRLYAEEKNYPCKSLSCTIIVLIFSPVGLLVTHIGDGRAGFETEGREWKSIITPHKGEYANETIFITNTNAWRQKDFTLNGVTVPESRGIYEKPKAFCLMTDGCENHSFECSIWDEEKQIYRDINRPYDKFFNPLVAALTNMQKNGIEEKEISLEFEKFLKEGNLGLMNESDDKTMVIGVLNHEA